MPDDSLICISFSHLDAYRQSPGISFPESFSFQIIWERSNLPLGTPAAVDGISFVIMVRSDGLQYKPDTMSTTSNFRSNLSRERILSKMVDDDPQTASLMTEYLAITALLQLIEFQEELLKECVGIFLEAKT